MTFIKITYKLIALVLLAIAAVFMMFVYSFASNQVRSNTTIFNAATPNEKQKAYRKKWLQKIVKIIGLRLEIKGSVANYSNENKKNALWVSNHISWMDIVVIGSQGVGFLSKAQVRKWPVIGWLGEKSGTVFINRGAKNASQVAAKAIAEKIQAGDNILVFPEATTTSGENIKRFHARIFAPALDHQLLVQPLVIRYLDDQGQIHPGSIWKEQSFMKNMMGVLAQSNIRVVLTYLPVVDAKQFNERRELAELLENQIRDVVLSKAVLQT